MSRASDERQKEIEPFNERIRRATLVPDLIVRFLGDELDSDLEMRFGE